jgi:hypothetical protein
VGADAGFAAIIGLAILVLLYFAQARETTTLRDEAISASQRVEQLERRVSQLGGPPVAPAPESTTSSAQARTSAPPAAGTPAPAVGTAPARAAANPVPTAAPGTDRVLVPERASVPQASTQAPVAPAGVGAPPLADATRLIPVAEGGRPAAKSAQPAGEAASAEPAGEAAQPAVEVAQPAAESAQPAGEAPRPAAEVAQPPAETGEERAGPEPQAPREGVVGGPAPSALATPPPATAAAGAAPPQTGEGPPGPVAANGGGGPPRPRPAAASPLRQAPPRSHIRDGARSPRPLLSLGARGPRNRWLPALLGVLVLAGVIAALLVVTSGGGSSHHAAATRSTNAPGLRGGFNPASVTVAVLNGTDVAQLAHRVEQKLTRTGYKGGTVATAADQTHKASAVAYLPGYQSNAMHVASSLGLPSSAVQPVDQSARAIACPPPSACGASVVVIVGSDLASTT